jgi:hypothetical protein
MLAKSQVLRERDAPVGSLLDNLALDDMAQI